MGEQQEIEQPEVTPNYAALVEQTSKETLNQLGETLDSLDNENKELEEDHKTEIDKQNQILQDHVQQEADNAYFGDVTQFQQKPLGSGLHTSVMGVDSLKEQHINKFNSNTINLAMKQIVQAPTNFQLQVAESVMRKTASGNGKQSLNEYIHKNSIAESEQSQHGPSILTTFQNQYNNKSTLFQKTPLQKQLETNFKKYTQITPVSNVNDDQSKSADQPLISQTENTSQAGANTTNVHPLLNAFDLQYEKYFQTQQKNAIDANKRLANLQGDTTMAALLTKLEAQRDETSYQLQQQKIDQNITLTNTDTSKKSEQQTVQSINPTQFASAIVSAVQDSDVVHNQIAEEQKEQQEKKSEEQSLIAEQVVQKEDSIQEDMDVDTEHRTSNDTKDQLFKLQQKKQNAFTANLDKRTDAEIQYQSNLAQLKIDASNAGLERNKLKMNQQYLQNKAVLDMQTHNKQQLQQYMTHLSGQKATNKINQLTEAQAATANKIATTYNQQKTLGDLTHQSKLELLKLYQQANETQRENRFNRVAEQLTQKINFMKKQKEEDEQSKIEIDKHQEELKKLKADYETRTAEDKKQRLQEKRSQEITTIKNKSQQLEKTLLEEKKYEEERKKNKELIDIQLGQIKNFKAILTKEKQAVQQNKEQSRINDQASVLTAKIENLERQIDMEAKKQKLKEDSRVITKMNVLKQQIQNTNAIVNTTIDQLRDQLLILSKQEQSERTKMGEGNYTTDLIRNVTAFRRRTLQANDDLKDLKHYKMLVQAADTLDTQMNEAISMKRDKLTQAILQDQKTEEVSQYLEDREQLNRAMASSTYDMLDAAFRKNGMKPLSLSKEDFLNKYAALSLDMSTNGLKKRRVGLTIPVATSIDKISNLEGSLNDDDVRNIVTSSSGTTFGNLMANIYELQQYLIRKARENPQKRELAAQFMTTIQKYVKRNNESIIANSRAFFGTQYSKLAVADMLQQEEENHKILQQARQRKREEAEKEKQISAINNSDPSRLMPGSTAGGNVSSGGGGARVPSYQHKFRRGFYPNTLYYQQPQQQQLETRQQQSSDKQDTDKFTQHSKVKSANKNIDTKLNKTKAIHKGVNNNEKKLRKKKQTDRHKVFKTK